MSRLLYEKDVIHALCRAVHKDKPIPCENQACSCLWSKTRVCDYVREIGKLPSAQSEPLTAEFIPVDDRETAYGLLFKCSNCGTEFIVNDALEHNYCSECGRKFVRLEDGSNRQTGCD